MCNNETCLNAVIGFSELTVMLLSVLNELTMKVEKNIRTVVGDQVEKKKKKSSTVATARQKCALASNS